MGRPFPAPSRALPPPAPRPWVLHEQGNANEFCLLAPDGKDWILGLLHNGAPLAAQQEANLRFLVLAVNNHDALVAALQGMQDSLALALGPASPLPPVAKDALRGFFLGEAARAASTLAQARSITNL